MESPIRRRPATIKRSADGAAAAVPLIIHQHSGKSEVFLLSEDIIKAGNYDHPLQKYHKRKILPSAFSCVTIAKIKQFTHNWLILG